MIFWIIYYSLVHISLFGTVLRGILTRFLMSSSICGKVQTPKNPCSNMFYAVHLWTKSKFLNSKSKGSVYLRKSRIKVRHMSYFEQSFKYFYISWIFFLCCGWPTKGVYPYVQPGPLSEILTIANLRHASSRIWTCAEPEFSQSWMKLWSSAVVITTAKSRYYCHVALCTSCCVDWLLLNILCFFLFRRPTQNEWKKRAGRWVLKSAW